MTALAAPPRRPRFTRAGTGTLPLRAIHEAILAQVGRFGLLNSSQLEQLVPAISGDRLRKHAADLYHHGYLERPAGQQAALYTGPGSRPMVYTLSRAGARMLQVRLGTSPALLPRAKSRVEDKAGAALAPPKPLGTWPALLSGDVGHGYLAHELLVRDVLCAAEVACRSVPALQLKLWPDLVAEVPVADQAAEWRVRVRLADVERTVSVRPDAIVAFKNHQAPDERSVRHAFVELDRATMPIMRRDLYGSSVMRKWLAYSASEQQGIFSERLGARRARVLIVTTSEKRVRAMVEAFGSMAERYDLPARLFLFAEFERVVAPGAFFDPVWVDGAGVARRVFG